MRQFEYWNDGVCVPADTPTLKIVEDINEGLERFYIGDCEESSLYRGECLQNRCKAHVCPAVTKS